MWRLLPFLLALEERVDDSEMEEHAEDENGHEKDSANDDYSSNGNYRLPEIEQGRALEREAEGDRSIFDRTLEEDVDEPEGDGGYPPTRFADPESIYNKEDDVDPEGVESEPVEGAKELMHKAFDNYEEQLNETREKVANDNERTMWDRFKTGVKNLPYQAVSAAATLVGTPIAVYENRKTKKELSENPDTEKQIMYIEHGLGQTRGSGVIMARQARKEGYLPILIKGNHSIDDAEAKLQSKYDQIQSIHEETGLENVANRNDIYRGHSSGGNSTIEIGSDSRVKDYGIGVGQALAPAPYGIRPKGFTQRLLFKLLPNASKEDTRTDEGKEYALKMASKRPHIPIQIVAGQYDAGVRPEDALYKHATDIRYIKGPGSTHFRTSHADPRTNRVTLEYLKEFMKSIKDETHPQVGMRYDPSRGFEEAASSTLRPEDYEPANDDYQMHDKAA